MSLPQLAVQLGRVWPPLVVLSRMLALGRSAVCKCLSLHPVSPARRGSFNSRHINWTIPEYERRNVGGVPKTLCVTMILLKQKKENVESREWTNELKVL